MNLASELKNRGVDIHEVNGWISRGRPYNFLGDAGVMIHHTAGSNSLDLIINGRGSIPGPLSQFLIHKSGTVYLVAGGYANHAGSGSSVVYNQARLGIAPSRDARHRSLPDDMTGNKHFWGVEVENLGNGADPYPEKQIESLVNLCAALCDIYDYSPNSVIHHREWTKRKPDMSYKGNIRQMIAQRLKQLNNGAPQRRYTMIVYAEGRDILSVLGQFAHRPRAVFTTNPSEAMDALSAGEEVTAVGASAANRLFPDVGVDENGKRLVGIYKDGNKRVVVGKDSKDTEAQMKRLFNA